MTDFVLVLDLLLLRVGQLVGDLLEFGFAHVCSCFCRTRTDFEFIGMHALFET